ncbi:membrane-associated tyrosine- and threonine-specific cdc2-inhibitory kinase-like [Scleropages formosus]|uniref:non-specific serine/threonine protein kinase n=1 Tax=Scleropages formosus TaxID=113540 RepID=A0A0P7Y9Z9_SCLFO|nr:membrane-associated tyrosine- and threonine-specific cdc2-inhibitory kinase-like [Scleropages formosus]
MSIFCEPTLTATPLPIPVHFSQAQKSFCLKKRRLPFSSSSSSSPSVSSPHLLSHSLPPRPPSKGYPPVSRLFSQRPPSPWTPHSRSLIKTPPPASLYDPGRPQSYFSQCFTNLGLLGRGSFGEVYKVLSLQDGQLYAVKRTVQCFRGHADRRRSLREARNHERLGPHPHILGFQAAWEEKGHLYIQTELCCTNLLMYAEAKEPNLDEAAVWGYLCDLLLALQHLHSQGFIHLDIKPANVFLTQSGRLKLGDFGLMVIRKGEQIEGLDGEERGEGEEGQEGDPRYMAPELLRGEYSPAADVFSLGVSILELACNIEVPKGGDGWQELRRGNLPYEFISGLSADLRSVLKVMLLPDPMERATVSQLLALPVVRRQKLKRQVSLFLAESLLILFSFCKSMVLSGWGLLSTLHFPFLRTWMTAAPHTPTKDSWENDVGHSIAHPSFLHTDTGSLGEELVFFPNALGLDHSPTSSQRLQSKLSLGSTSTPLPKISTPSQHTPPQTPRFTHSPMWSVTHTPGSTRSSCSPSADVTALAHSMSQSASSTCDDSPSKDLGSAHSPVLNWVRPEPCSRPVFEPKNLLSLFDEATLEGLS